MKPPSIPVALLLLAPLAVGTPMAPAQRVAAQVAPAREVELTSARVRIPFGRVDRRVSVAGLINGKGPYHFILDTGASGEGRIDIDLATQLGLRRVGRVLQDDTTGSGAQIKDTVAVDELRLAGAVFRNVSFTSADYEWIAGQGELPVHGILGLGLFEDVQLEIDYPAYRLTLSDERLDAKSPHTVRYSRKHGLCAVPLQIGATRLSAILDTGSAAGLLVPESWQPHIETTRKPRLTARGRLANNAFQVESAPLRQTPILGGHQLEGLSVGFVDVDLLPNIGYEILRDFVLTFDQRSRRVRILRADQAREAAAGG